MKLIIEPGRSAKNYWRDLWKYRELMYFLAWRDIAVRYKQTVIGVAWALIQPALTMLVFVGFRRLVGFPPSRCSGANSGVFRGTALAVFFNRTVRVGGQPAWQCQPHLQGLFSASHYPMRGGGHKPRGFSYHPRPAGGAHAVVRLHAQLASCRFAIFYVAGLWPFGWLGSVACRPQRRVPRFPLYRTLHRPIRAVRVADCIQHGECTGSLAHALCPQSDGGCYRRLPLVHPGWSHTARTQHGGDFGRRYRFVSVSRRVVLSPNGAQLR